MSKPKKKRNKQYTGTLAGALPITLRFTDDQARRLKLEPHMELVRIAEGIGDGDACNTIVIRLKASMVLAERIFTNAVDTLHQGLVAVESVRARKNRVGKWGASDAERELIHDALVLADDVQDQTTRREQRAAMLCVYGKVRLV